MRLLNPNARVWGANFAHGVILRSFWGHFGVILGSPDELEIAPLLDRKVESDRHCDHLRSFGGVGAIPG